LEQALRDLRYAIRGLCKNPVLTTMAVLSLGLGIAATTAVFTIFNALYLTSLPYPEPERLVYLHETAPSRNMAFVAAAYPDFHAWREHAATFADMAAFRDDAGANLTGFGDAARVKIAFVTFNMAATLGIRPIRGRDFLPEEDRDGPAYEPSGHKVVLISYGLWQRHFGQALDVLGKTVSLDNASYTIIGVLPQSAVFPADTDVWMPLGYEANTTGPLAGYLLNGVGRLKPGVTIEQATADVTRAHKNLASIRPQNKITQPAVIRLREYYLGKYRVVSEGLAGMAIFVLLIACINVMCLTMARGTERAKDLAIRVALGAQFRRLVRQLLVENLLLAIAGAAAGVLLGWLVIRAFLTLVPGVLPSWVDFRLDIHFLWFVCAITGTVALISGLAPALRSASTDISALLARATSKASLSGAGRRTLKILTIGEIALAMVLLASGGVAIKAFQRVLSLDPGFRSHNVLTFSIDPALPPDQRFRFCRDLLDRLRLAEGVDAAGATNLLPLGDGMLGHGDWGGTTYRTQDTPVARPGEQVLVGNRLVTPGYFRAMGIALTRGRDFDDRDSPDSRVVIVNESFVRQFFSPGTQVIGERVFQLSSKKWFRVVGVVRDTRHSGLDEAARPEAFGPYPANLLTYLTIVVRGKTNLQTMAATSREIVRQMDPTIALFDVRSMEERLDRSLWARRSYSWLFGVFAGIALLMAVAGIYGVVSYTISQRTREIGIRIALGARRGQVISQVLREGLVVLGIGIATGLTAAWFATRMMGSLLAGLNPHDPVVYISVVLVLIFAAMAANLFPARRAALVDPVKALRSD
jgi:predicted permease